MADESVASIIPWHQPKTAKARPKRTRVAKPAKPTKTASKAVSAKTPAPADDETISSESLILPDFMELVQAPAKSNAPAGARRPEAREPAADFSLPVVPPQEVIAPEIVSAAAVTPVAPPARETARHGASSYLLQAAALALAAVGMAMNGWFAQSLGSSSIAGWMFLAIGVTADLVALVMPTCAARLWQARHRASALAGWMVWVMTFVFAVTAGIGFASTNISDVTLARASRVTPAVQAAQSLLSDAMAARDRECKGGVGKFCREREAAVAERRQALDVAMSAVSQGADPQTEAAIKLVAWVSHGLVKPSADDFAMLRLILLALLPQIGGILLMVGRRV